MTVNEQWTESDFGGPDGSAVKNPPANAGDPDLIPELGRSPGEGNGNPLQYSCLGNPIDRGAWWAAVHGVTEELETTTKQQQQRKRIRKLNKKIYV